MKIKLPERVDFYFDGGCDTFALSDFEEQDGRYVLKNSFVWDGNVPDDILTALEYI